MANCIHTLKMFALADEGATAIEYGLIAAIMGIGLVVSLSNVQDALNTVFNDVSTNFE